MVASYLVRRAIGFAFVLLGLSVVIFTVGRIVPGDPARMALGPLATNEQVAQLREEMGFSKPAVVAVRRLSRRQSLQGNLRQIPADQPGGFGRHRPGASGDAGTGLFTLFLIAVLAVPLGVLAARRHNSWIDNASRLVSLLGVVTPGFVFAILLQLLRQSLSILSAHRPAEQRHRLRARHYPPGARRLRC